MDSVKLAYGSRGMTMVAARQWGALMDWEEDNGEQDIGEQDNGGIESSGAYTYVQMIEFHAAILLRYSLLSDYHLVRGSMPLHDAVGVKKEKGATTDIGAGA